MFLPGESHGQRSLVGSNPYCHTELDMSEATWRAHRTQEGHIHLWGISLSILVSLCFAAFSSFIHPQLQSVLFWHLEATFEKFLWFKPFLAPFLCPTISPCHSFLQDSALEDSVLNSENLKEINYLMSFLFHMGTASLSWILYIVKQYNDNSKWKKIHPQFHPVTRQLFSVLLSLLGFAHMLRVFWSSDCHY